MRNFYLCKEKKKTMRREIHNSEYYYTIIIVFLLSDEWNKRSERATKSVTKINHQYAFLKKTEKHTKNNS